MLSQQAFKDNIQVLYATFRHKGNMKVPDKITLQVWYQAVSDMTDEQLVHATAFIVRNDEWFPTMARIRKVAGFSLETENSTAEAQWEIFSRKIQSVGYRKMLRIWHEEGRSVFDDPVTDSVARTFAEEYALSNVSEAGNWRARFIAAYNNTKEHGIKTTEVQKISSIMSNMLGADANLKLVKS